MKNEKQLIEKLLIAGRLSDVEIFNSLDGDTESNEEAVATLNAISTLRHLDPDLLAIMKEELS